MTSTTPTSPRATLETRRLRPAHEASAIGLQRFMASRGGAGRRILETATRVSSVLSRPTAARATASVAVEEVGALRSLDMPTFVSDALRAHSEGPETRPEGVWRDLVFATGAGTPHGHRNLRRALRRLCEDADLPALTLYDLRRTAGSLLVDAGVHLECVADLLGHSSVATTRRHYVRAVRPTVPHAVGLDAVLG